MAVYTTIDNPTAYFNTKLIPSASEITSVGHQADMIWLKSRTNAYSSELIDTVRGIDKKLKVDDTSGESTTSTVITAIGSDSYTVGSGSNAVYSGSSGVGWSWKAGTSFTNDASSTGIGTIDSAGSVSDASGFSIVSYTGTGSNGSVKHGLSTVPKIFITKRLNSTSGWVVWHKSIGTNILELNENGASQSGSSYINGTVPTSSVFSISTSGDINASGGTFIVYCFADVKGYSKIGSYTGNGNADGTFVYTGFKPAWIMTKKSNSTGNWVIVDTKRDGYNGANDTLQANVTDVESGGNRHDIVSNGFKARSTSSYSNSSGDTFIYMAFSESSFVNSNGVPTNAR